MTDNEKRAHDLALVDLLLVAPEKIQADKSNAVKSDYFGIYKQAYDEALRKVNKAFPQA